MVTKRMVTSREPVSLNSNAAARWPAIRAVPPWTHHGQREDGHLVLGIVWQVLVQVAQAVGVLAELVIHDAQLVTCCNLPARAQGLHSSVACSMVHLAVPAHLRGW